jgi:hypothetical protein
VHRRPAPHRILTSVKAYAELIEFIVFRLMLLTFFLWGVIRLLGVDLGFELGEHKAKMVQSVSHAEDVPSDDPGHGRH